MTRSVSPEDISARLLELLPSDGTPVANRIVRSMLSRSLQCIVTGDQYFEVVTRLSEERKIGRARGRGGSVFAIEDKSQATTAADPTSEPGDGWTEAALMKPVKVYLETEFVKYLDLPPRSTTVVADTSNLGPRTGQWARPDFLLVSIMRFELMPGRQVDVHAFELKASYGGSVQAVHEALAQTRFTHFGHLIWHVPQGSTTEVLLPEIEEHCRQHGLGLIVIRDPRAFETWEVRLDPAHKGTAASTVDAFLLARLPATHRARILEAVIGDGQ